MLPDVTTSAKIEEVIAKLCVNFAVQGHRADLISERTARTNAAFEGRLTTTIEDVIVAAEMALPHRANTESIEGEFGRDMIERLVRMHEREE